MNTEKTNRLKTNYTFIINGHIKFVPSRRIIEDMKTGTKIKLYVPASLCLDKLIKNQGRVVSQHELIQCGWGEKRESTVSSNTFYQCILHLRKNFSQMGLCDVIETVPRHGIIFNESFNVSMTQSEPPQPGSNQTEEAENEKHIELAEYCDENADRSMNEGELLSSSEKPSDKPSEPLIAVANKKGWLEGYLYVSIMISLLVSLFVTIGFAPFRLNKGDIFDSYIKLKSGKCSIYANDKQYSAIEINDIINSVGLSCLNNDVVFFTKSPMQSRLNIIHCTSYTQKNQNCRSVTIINESKVTP
ncbi:winged helix-turn-helix domain-containing protein [Pantoea anthophila]|uniref:winged helix-turn-helix domain-containing protein n=1 Tax=Pantoea anthophila TaxID=470931 RepID=UPI000907F2F0|nr:winged helix-turn-helix domain-containing protein [Pantoea anthophila]